MFGYCAGNPIKNTDYNGADIWDKIAGVFIGVTSNVLPVPGLRDAYSPNDPLDYNSSLMAADKASTMVGEAMIAAGIAASAAGKKRVVRRGVFNRFRQGKRRARRRVFFCAVVFFHDFRVERFAQRSTRDFT